MEFDKESPQIKKKEEEESLSDFLITIFIIISLVAFLMFIVLVGVPLIIESAKYSLDFIHQNIGEYKK